MANSEQIMLDVLDGYLSKNRWQGTQFEKIKMLSSMGVRKVGLDFIARWCDEFELDHEFSANRPAMRSWPNPWDMKINKATFEVKTATENENGNFHFSGIRPYRGYEAILCLGITPDVVLFDAWSKSDLIDGAAGNLINMGKGEGESWNLMKQSGTLRPVAEFGEHIRLLTWAIASGRYQSDSEAERRKIDLLVHLGLHEIPDDGKSLQETMMEVSHNAKKRGLTSEILQSILNEIDSDASVRI